MNDIKDIKAIRKKFNLTQSDLAKRSGVSQSLIAKVEAGILDPTYSKAQKIFQTLDSLNNKSESKVSEIMNAKIITLTSNSTVSEALQKMKKFSISQIPITEGKGIIGLVTETSILNKLSELNNTQDLPKLKVREILEETPPIITSQTSTIIASNLLKHYQVLLVVDNGKLKGLLTKSDILKHSY